MTRQGKPGPTAEGRPLELSELVASLEIHGARLERWPAALAERARPLLAASVEARRAQSEAAALDALLDQAPSIEPSAALLSRVAALPALHPRRGFWSWWPFESVSRPAFAWLTAAVVGVAVGHSVPSDELDGAAARDGVAAVDEVADGSDLDTQAWDELGELSFAFGLDEEE
jgi:hypothetical protein